MLLRTVWIIANCSHHLTFLFGILISHLRYLLAAILGAKHIFSSIIKSSDVLELTRQNIDIKSDMSFELQFAIGASANEGQAPMQEGGNAADDEGMVIKVLDCRKGEEPDPLMGAVDQVADKVGGSSLGGSAGFSTSNSRESMSLTERINSIQKKVKTVNEINIGGRPPVDGNWKTWAQTVRERPMPVVIETEGIWEHGMDEDQTKNFFDAIISRYGLDLSIGSTSEVLQSMHFGLYRPTAVPLSSYSTGSNDNYRFLLSIQSVDMVPIDIAKMTLPLLIDSDGAPKYSEKSVEVPGGEISCPSDSLVCGASVRYGKFIFKDVDNDDTIFGLRFKCCGIGNWWDKDVLEVQNPDPSAWLADIMDSTKFHECNPGQFVDAVDTRYVESGRTLLYIRCTGSTEYMPVYDGILGPPLVDKNLSKTGPEGSVIRGASVTTYAQEADAASILEWIAEGLTELITEEIRGQPVNLLSISTIDFFLYQFKMLSLDTHFSYTTHFGERQRITSRLFLSPCSAEMWFQTPKKISWRLWLTRKRS
jgi:hypothetical protein